MKGNPGAYSPALFYGQMARSISNMPTAATRIGTPWLDGAILFVGKCRADAVLIDISPIPFST